MKANTISNIVKDFMNADILKQKELLMLFLLSHDDYQYLAYLIYDMILNESGMLKTQSQSETIYEHFHWSIQKYFKHKSDILEKKTNELKSMKDDDIPYEHKIMLYKFQIVLKRKH